MPIYELECSKGHQFEEPFKNYQALLDFLNTDGKCPKCGLPLERSDDE